VTRARGALAIVLVAAVATAAQAKPRKVPPPSPPPPAPELPGAESFWDRVKRPDHRHVVEQIAQARLLFSQGRYADAAVLLERAVAAEPNALDAWFYLGIVYERLDRFDDCATALANVDVADADYRPESFPDGYPHLQAHLALCLAAAGRPDESVPHYQAALDAPNLQADKRATLVYNLADAYQSLGRLEQAIAGYEQAIEISGGNRALYRFSLAIALDRDEQSTRARDVMTEAAAYDPMLSSLGGADTIYTPAADEDYYRGFALETLAGMDTRKQACGGYPGLCRPMARLYFRRFVQRAPDSPWRARAEAHLADLGDGAPQPGEIDVRADGVEPKPYVQLVIAAVPRLAKCLDQKPQALFFIEITLPRKDAGKPPPAPKPVKPIVDSKKKPGPRPVPTRPGLPLPADPLRRTIIVRALLPAQPDDVAQQCLSQALDGVKWPAPAARVVQVRFAIAGP
jgi:tetratricopeptide (TPR) repeat protein